MPRSGRTRAAWPIAILVSRYHLFTHAQRLVHLADELDAVHHGVQIRCLAVPLAEVLELDARPPGGVGRGERNAAGAVCRIRLQHGPSEAVPLPLELVGVAGRVPTEVAGQTEDVQIRLLALRVGSLEDSDDGAVPGVNAPPTLPLDEIRVCQAVAGGREQRLVEQYERLLEFRDHADLVAVLQVFSDAGYSATTPMPNRLEFLRLVPRPTASAVAGC